MSRNSPSVSPREPKKEACPCTARGEPCSRDVNHATTQSQTDDSHTFLYRRSPACEHMDITDNNRIGANCHPEPFSNPLANTNKDGVSEKGNPVVVGQPNDGDIEKQYLLLARATSNDTTSTFSELELSQGSSRFSGSFNRDCKYQITIIFIICYSLIYLLFTQISRRIPKS